MFKSLRNDGPQKNPFGEDAVVLAPEQALVTHADEQPRRDRQSRHPASLPYRILFHACSIRKGGQPGTAAIWVPICSGRKVG